MNRIKQLSKNLINQIAAGEVIERPASAVKELVENSIDAGASRIEITVSNSCRDIRIADNGSGIHPDDIEAAFIKHATSKLEDENGLFNIKTLGFRGEALASIISVSKVSCTTRTKDFDYGIKAEAENSEIKTVKTGCAIGTVMEIKDLFFNQSARLKFLKSEKTEFAYIQELIQALAIANPSIAFILKNVSNTVINTIQNSDLNSRIMQIYSNDIINHLRKVNKSDDLTGIHVSGFISEPDYTRSSRKSIYTFVNSRIIKCPVLSKAIDTAYKNMMPMGRYPFAVLNLEINPEEIDVNVHPQKREIRYKNTNQIFNFVQSAVSYALISSGQRQTSSFLQDSMPKILPFKYDSETPEFIPKNEDNESFAFPLKIIKADNALRIENTEQKKIDISFEMPRADASINVIGQLFNTYILIDNGDNLEIIDQHIAQERYIYEKLKNQKEAASQLLIISDVLDTEPSETEMLENAKPALEKFGFKIEKISDTQVIFKKIPQILSRVNLKEILAELLKNLKDSPDNELDTLEEKILITASCKASIKAGDKLTLFQMEEIAKNLRSTKNPYTCPHGRPISHFIPQKDIAAFFARNI